MSVPVSLPMQAGPAGTALTLRTRAEGDVIVVTVDGEADLATHGRLTDGFRRALNVAPPAVVLDVSALRYASAQSVRFLAAITANAAHRGVVVAVVGMSPRLTWMWLLNDHPVPTQYSSVERATAALNRLSLPADDAATPPPRMQALQAEVEGLRRAMVSRAVIEQAKGILMQRWTCTADVAFAALSRESQQSNRKVAQLAADVVAGKVRSLPET